MSGSPQRLGDVLPRVITGLGLDRRLEETRLVEAWRDVSGERISRATRNVWAKGEVLHVELSSAAWRNELHLQREGWRDRINRHLGADLVREIRFR